MTAPLRRVTGSDTVSPDGRVRLPLPPPNSCWGVRLLPEGIGRHRKGPAASFSWPRQQESGAGKCNTPMYIKSYLLEVTSMSTPAADPLLEANARYAESFRLGNLPNPPTRHLAVVACMDARLNVYALLGLTEGEAHVIRNAGGVVTEDVIRSLAISQRLLGTRSIVLVHHTECGMLTFKDDALKEEIERETGIRPPFAFEAFSSLEGDLRQSIGRLRLSPFLPHKEDIRAFIYDVRTGRLREVSP
jgi:carbonic anhydrase